MTYTKSSELPKEDGQFFLQTRWKKSTEISDDIVWLKEGRVYWFHNIFLLDEPEEIMSNSFERFHDLYELLAYCKIERPDE